MTVVSQRLEISFDVFVWMNFLVVNVLKGEMSFCGNSSEIPRTEQYSPEMMATLLLPAVTSLASII